MSAAAGAAMTGTAATAPAPVIDISGLTKRYGSHRGLDGLDLEVRPGEVFGFLGPNGAGKTTTIRLLLDLIRPTSGRIRVLGLDPRSGGPALRRRIGYLAGDFAIEGRQTAAEALTFLGHLRGGVDRSRIGDLADRLGLDPARPIRDLSKGNRQKVGLVQAFMHVPELLILDEPTSGLDPLVQREFLTMAREARAAGRTVFMSSHVLSEVQQIADRVAIIREGRLVTVQRVETLRERAVRRVEIRFAEPVPADAFAGLPDVSDVHIEADTGGTGGTGGAGGIGGAGGTGDGSTGSVLTCRVAGRADALVKAAAHFTVLSLLSEEPDLEELFLEYYNGREAAADDAV